MFINQSGETYNLITNRVISSVKTGATIVTLPCGSIKENLSKEQITAIQKFLSKWMTDNLPYYKENPAEQIFKTGIYDANMFNTIKIFARCHDIAFTGEITPEVKELFTNPAKIADLEKYENYTEGKFLYDYLKDGHTIKEGITFLVNTKKGKEKFPICKTYNIGYSSKYTKFIKNSINKWLPCDEKLDEKSDIFDQKTYTALQLFKYRFGLPSKGNEITNKDLAVFNDILNGTASLKKYPLNTSLKKETYALLCKNGISKTYALIKNKRRRRQMASRLGSFVRNTYLLIGVSTKLTGIFTSLAAYLNTYGYSVILTSGLRSNDKGSKHSIGHAIDCQIYTRKGHISGEESKKVVYLINNFIKENKLYGQFGCYNEYIYDSKNKTGDHMHLYLGRNP
ncbi:MAG: hypothetical protein ABIH00_10790 [Armatimonadota bacterium]